MKLWAKSVFLLNARIVAGRERRESEREVSPPPSLPCSALSPCASATLSPCASTTPPAQASSRPPLRKQLLRNKEALKCFPAQLRASQMSSCLPPVGPVPGVLTAPSGPHGNSRAWEGCVLTAQEAGFVEAAAFALNLFSEVHRLLAHPTLLTSSPVRHSESGRGNGN